MSGHPTQRIKTDLSGGFPFCFLFWGLNQLTNLLILQVFLTVRYLGRIIKSLIYLLYISSKITLSIKYIIKLVAVIIESPI